MVSTSGLVPIAEGREAQIFAWEPGKILRLSRDPTSIESTQGQALALAVVRHAGGPVPDVFGTVTADGRPGIIMERIDGHSLLERLASKPWDVGRVGSTLGRLHAEIHRILAPEVVPSTRSLLERALSSSLVPDDLSDQARDVLSRLPDGDRLCHGDFHPDNVLVENGREVVIDWTNLSRGDPHSDIARSLVLMRWGSPPQRLPLAIRLVDRPGRAYLTRRYLMGYRRRGQLRSDLVDQWQLVCAIARLAENVEGEQPIITAWARSKLLRRR
jgi:aminoglycoside phosphotransferase (APT) family kinase protein